MILVLNQTGLERDLLLFEAGDNTEVGEKGLTLRLGGSVYARVIRIDQPSFQRRSESTCHTCESCILSGRDSPSR